jgi:hypothetical protein
MGESKFGICRLSIIPGRKEASDASEMVTQLLYGEQYSVLENLGKWLLVRGLEDGYEFYIDKKQHTSTDENVTNSVVVCSAIAKLGEELTFVPGGSLLHGSQQVQNYTGELLDEKEKDVKKLALNYLNAPYLWGGKTILGIDCSGFTQVIFRMLGKKLPRDAWQQEQIGDVVKFNKCTTGDLAFFTNFKGDITHVGIVLIDGEDRNIIHASGKVRVDVLAEDGILMQETGERTHVLFSIKNLGF